MTPRRRAPIIIALGGNAIIGAGQRGTITEQFANTRKSLSGVVECIKSGYDVIITHGNGPQVGDALLRVEAARDSVPVMPLGVCVAETEGSMGYMIQQSLMNMLGKNGIKKNVVTIITQVVVDIDDPILKNPSKPIGPTYAEWEAKQLAEERNWKVISVPGGKYRRVVASPKPLEIVETDILRHLIKHGEVVIAAGGGGIPVYRESDGKLEGVDVVVDKDLASAVLGKDVKAGILLMITAVDGAYLNYDTTGQKLIPRMSVDEAKRYLAVGHFPPGSMGPKIEASIQFLQNGGKKAVICSIGDVVEALKGKKGTTIEP